MSRLLVAFLLVAGLSPDSVALSQTRSQFDAFPLTITATERALDASDGATFRSLFSDLAQELVGLPSKSTAIALGLGGELALASHPADRVLTEHLARSVSLHGLFELGESVGGGWVQGGAALTTFVIGRTTGNRRVQTVGADLVQAQIVAAVITQGVKLAVDRKRPNKGRFSFPSGHTSSTFASAAVLHRHFGWKVGFPAYAVASYVAVSRLQENAHYASDVIFGAALGLVAGRTVTVGHGHGALSAAPLVVRGGAGVAFTSVR